ncbi:MAG: SpoIIE family protein phosphatase [Planctomycetota bacterium]
MSTGGAAPKSTAGPRTFVERSGVKIPIAVKYAGITAVLVLGFVAYVSRSSYVISLAELDSEINRGGIALTALAARSIDPFWSNKELAEFELLEKQTQLANGIRAWLDDPGLEGVLDVLVFESKDRFIVSASGRDRFGLVGERPLPSPDAEEAGVEVFQGSLRAGGRDTPARSYERPITRPHEKEVLGYVRVFLSAQDIEVLKEKLLATLTITLIVALLIAIPAVVLVGGILTRPIRVLRNDMTKVAAGELEHQSTIHTGDELESLALAFNRMTAHLADAQERESRRKAIERELSIATTIQTALLPDEIPALPGFELFPFYQSAKEVGGDYYDFLQLDETRYGIVVADVSGKGIPGSLVMTMTRSLVRMAARASGGPAELLTRVNSSLSRDMTRGMFVTLIYAEIDVATGMLRLARAGHNPAYLYRASSRRLESLQPGGIALGMVDDLFAPNLEISQYALGPNDLLVLYTDGIIEAMDDEGNEYSSGRFERVLAQHVNDPPHAIVQAVLSDVERHTNGAEPSDDITLLVLKRQETA